MPPEFAQYYDETQFAPLQTQLQTLATAYAKGDGFQFSRAANQLRDGLRELSPKIYPEESQLRLEYFYNHWDGFYRAAWCYGIALVLLAIAYARGKGGALQCDRRLDRHCSVCSFTPADRDALPDRGPAAGDEHV